MLSLVRCTQPAPALLLSAAAQYGGGGTPPIPPDRLWRSVPPFAQGGLFFTLANTTGKGKESMAVRPPDCPDTGPPPGARKRSGKSRVGTAILSLLFFTQPAGCGSTIRPPRHWAQRRRPLITCKLFRLHAEITRRQSCKNPPEKRTVCIKQF